MDVETVDFVVTHLTLFITHYYIHCSVAQTRIKHVGLSVSRQNKNSGQYEVVTDEWWHDHRLLRPLKVQQPVHKAELDIRSAKLDRSLVGLRSTAYRWHSCEVHSRSSSTPVALIDSMWARLLRRKHPVYSVSAVTFAQASIQGRCWWVLTANRSIAVYLTYLAGTSPLSK